MRRMLETLVVALGTISVLACTAEECVDNSVKVKTDTEESTVLAEYDDPLHETFCTADPDTRDERLRHAAGGTTDDPNGLRFFAVGEVVASALTPSKPHEGWMFFLCQERYVTIQMASSSIDSQLGLARGIVTGQDSEMITMDDDSGDGLNAKIDIRLQPGSYKLLTTTYSGANNKFGSYTLSIRTQ